MLRRRTLAALLAVLLALAPLALADEAEPEASGLDFGGEMELEPGDGTLQVRFRLQNLGERTVTGCWIQVFGTDAEGTTIYSHDEGGWWTEGEIPPGGAAYSAAAEIPDDARIVALHTLVLAVAYADGSEWELDTIDPAEAGERGLVADWDLPALFSSEN